MVNPINADYFDGKSARRSAATIRLVGDIVVVAHGGTSAEYPLPAVRVQPQLKGAPRRIEFPDGSAAVTDDHAAVNAVFGAVSTHTLAHRLESHPGFVITALVGVVAAVVMGYLYGVPWSAREIAQRLPIALESQIADAGLKSLDQAIFKPSTLASGARSEVSIAFATLRAATDLPATVRLEFRDGDWIGANAFALPGGVVVVTDQLVNTMPGVNETVAVLAHELGHVQHRHSLRHLLQTSISALAAAAIFGDVASLTSIAVTVPTALIHSGYSRDFEREADSFAFALLKKTGRSPTAFAAAMNALEAAHGDSPKETRLRKKLGLPDAKPSPDDESDSQKAPDTRQKSEFDYFSTHPATADRIRAAEAAAAADVR